MSSEYGNKHHTEQEIQALRDAVRTLSNETRELHRIRDEQAATIRRQEIIINALSDGMLRLERKS